MKDFFMLVFDKEPYFEPIIFYVNFGICLIPFLTLTNLSWLPIVSYKLAVRILSIFKFRNEFFYE